MAKQARFELPSNGKVQFVDGRKLIEIKAAAKLSGIPAAVLEMAQRLLKNPEGEGGVFLLANAEIQKKANEIEEVFRAGLKKVGKALGPGGLTVKSYRDEDRLIFWYAFAGAAAKGKHP